MNSTIRRGLLVGLTIGLVLLGGIVVLTLLNTEPAFRNEGYALGMMLTLIAGIPTSLLINGLAVLLWDTRIFPVLYAALAISVVLNWALLGMLVSWLSIKFRQRMSSAANP